MSDGRDPRWGRLRNIQTALRSSHDARNEGQPRGWEQRREGNRPDATDPPLPNRPAYGYSQQYSSDPGPHGGVSLGYNSPPPSAQGQPPLLHNHHYQGQSQAGFSQQGYGAPPPPNSYQSTYSQAYGQNQGYMTPQPPASNPPPHSNYQQQSTSSADQNYQGGPGAYPYSYNQPTYQPASNSYSPPLDPRRNTQNIQGTSQSPSFAGPSYPAQSSGGALGLIRTATAPPPLQCEHTYPGNGL
ncbi:MAG: hypothetical protein Q9161_001016 [Pseudevernia consocians]